MASVSSKGGDLKKNSSTKTVLSATNNNTEKSPPKSALLKSPTSKTSPKSTLSALKINNESGKTNGLAIKKMDSTSPPKVARSPSAKSITPPNKVVKSSSPKHSLDPSNSQTEGIVTPIVKSESVVENDTLQSKEISDVACSINSMPDMADSVSLKNETFAESVSDKVSSVMQDRDKKPIDDSIKEDTTHSVEQLVLTTEQNLASGDKAVAKDKSELKQFDEAASLFEGKEIIEMTNGDGASGVTIEIVKNDDFETHQNNETSSDNNFIDKEQPKIINDVSKGRTDENFRDVTASSSPKDSADTSATDCTECSAETTKLVSEPEITKQSLRLEIWAYLDKNDLVVFPRPCKGRIPNFKGAPAASEKLTTLEVFKNSKTIKINPDKPQEMVRYHTLEYGKRLLVPVPRLREGLFQAVVPPAEASKYQLQQASQRYGMKKWSKSISIDDKVSIDLIVLGSVLVDRKGHRIGKGEGFADLEFAMLVKMNAVNKNTVIVTTVHDDQVRDELPEHLFKEHDVPVDWIVTPTQVIEVTDKLSRPKGIIWEILSNRRILEIPILQKLREQEMSEGHECALKEVDSDVEEKPYVPRFTRRRHFNNYSRSTGDPLRDNKLQPQPQYYSGPQHYYLPQQNRMNNYNSPRRSNVAPPQPQHKRVYYEEEYEVKQPTMNRQIREARGRSMNHNGLSGPTGPMMNRPRSMNQQRIMNRPRSMARSRSMNRSQNGPRYPSNRQHSDICIPLNNNNAMMKSVEVQTVDKNTRPNRPYIKRKRPPFEFSLRVKNIGMGVRVRDLKVALNERGVKPRDITWRGYKGFAFLHFVKPTTKDENNKPFTVEDVMQTLQGLPLPPKEKKSLVIEPLKGKSSDENQMDFNLETVITSAIPVTTEL